MQQDVGIDYSDRAFGSAEAGDHPIEGSEDLVQPIDLKLDLLGHELRPATAFKFLDLPETLRV